MAEPAALSSIVATSPRGPLAVTRKLSDAPPASKKSLTSSRLVAPTTTKTVSPVKDTSQSHVASPPEKPAPSKSPVPSPSDASKTPVSSPSDASKSPVPSPSDASITPVPSPSDASKSPVPSPSVKPAPSTPSSKPPSAVPTVHFDTYPGGVLLNLLPSDPMFSGLRCEIIYTANYDNPFDAEKVLKPVLNSHYFIGARRVDTNLFELGAFGSCSEIIKPTKLNKPHLSNDVYWYQTKKDSFGFLASEDLTQNLGDIGTKSPASRLSWSANSTTEGGHSRAGNQMNRLTNWEKVVYLCKANLLDQHQMRGASLVMSNVCLSACVSVCLMSFTRSDALSTLRCSHSVCRFLFFA